MRGPAAIGALCGVLLVSGGARADGARGTAATEPSTPATGCACSITFSPYHLAYPMLLASFEKEVIPRLGLTGDLAFGSFRQGIVGQLGFRLPAYALGSFGFGLQLGPFARATLHHLPDAHSVAKPQDQSAHEIGDVVYFDAELSRANAQHSIYLGALIGGKYVFAKGGAEPRTGPTLQAGFLVGYQALFGVTGQAPSPDASRIGSGFVPQLYADVGWTF